MASMRDNIQELVKEAGTRPAGSKQEFHAAEVIATRFGGFGLDATIEEFATDRFAPMMHLATLGLVAVGSLICFLTPKLAIVSLILVILGILLFLLELLDLNPLHRLLPTGLSQNVIARYNPHQFDGGSTSGGTASSGKPQRKIVVVARYDSPRTRIEAMSFLATRLRLLKTAQAALLGIAILPAILLLLPAPGIVQTIASWAALVCFGLLFVNFLVKLIDQFLPHQVGANVNLSGVGVLFGLADILGELLSNDEQRKGQTNVHRLRARREYRNQLAAAAGATNVSDKVEAAMVDGAEIESDGVQAATDSRSRSDAVGQEPASLTQGIPLQNNVDSDGALSGPMPMLHDASAASGPDVGDEMLRKNYGNGEDPRMRSDITGRIGNRVPGGSIAGNLVQVGSERASIFVTPRSESQENKQAEEFERDQSDLGQLDPVEVEEEPPAIDDEGGDEEDANLPEWYRKAKKAAEQKSERKIQDEEGGEVVRSRFADIPTPAHESGDGVNSPLIPAHQSENDTSLPPMANRRSSDAEISKIFQLQSETPMEPMPNELNFQDSILGFEPEVEADTLEASSDRPEITRSDNISDVSKASLATGIPSADAVPSADTAMHSAAAGEAGISAAPAFQQTAAVERPAVSPVSPSVPAPAALGSQLAQPALDDTRDRAVRKDQLGQNLQSDQQNQDLSFNRGDIRSKPDFSGLDKQAFRVVPDTNSATGALIVPTHDTDLSQEASRAGSQPKRRVERRRQERQAAVQPEQDTERQPAREQESNSSSQSNRQLDIQPEIQPENSDAGDKELQPEHDAKRSRLLNLPEVIESKAEQLTITQAGMEIVDVDADDLFASEESLVSNTGAFIPLGSTGVMKPIGDELLEYSEDPEESMFVDDADDDLGNMQKAHYTSTGSYSDPDLVDIKDSPVRSFFGRFSRRSKRDISGSPQDWLNIDEDFDVRREGSSIGSWDNFDDPDHDDSNDDSWRGGAYGGEDFEANSDALDDLSSALLDREVWLVALGAGELRAGGVRNFVKRHERSLRGSLFVNLLGVGAGDLCYSIVEGYPVGLRTDRRLQNLLSEAAQELAVSIAPRSFTAFDTDATEILRQKGRAISLIGMNKTTPLGWSTKDSDLGRIREEKLSAVSELILEIVKNS